MKNIEEYNDDGVIWFIKMVLIYIQGCWRNIVRQTYDENSNKYLASIFVNRYENGREQGYIISLRYKTWQMNWSIFTHCIWSDGIMVRPFEQYSDNPYTWLDIEWDKHHPADIQYDYTTYIDCSKFIFNDMYDSLKKVLKKEKNGENIASKVFND